MERMKWDLLSSGSNRPINQVRSASMLLVIHLGELLLALTNSANCLECVYGLRFVEWNNRGDYKWDGRGDYKTPYSVRQSAVYHRRDLNGSSTWILIAASTSIESRLKEYLQIQPESQASNPFEPHVLLLDSALANWRQYLIWLTEKTNEQVLHEL